MNGLATVTKLETKNNPTAGKGRVQEVKPRTLEDVLSESRKKPCAFKSWSVMVDKQVDAELLKRKLDKSRLSGAELNEVRKDVLANDRAYWM